MKRINTLKEMIKKTQKHQDLNVRLKLQNKIYQDQKQILERMEIDVKKKYQMSKRREYGIDNEQEIIKQIKKGIKNEIEKIEYKKQILQQNEEYTDESSVQV